MLASFPNPALFRALFRASALRRELYFSLFPCVRNRTGCELLAIMVAIRKLEHQANESAIRKSVGSELRKLYDPIVTSRLPEQMKDLIQRFSDRLERDCVKRQWW
jgi:hypothetical protein